MLSPRRCAGGARAKDQDEVACGMRPGVTGRVTDTSPLCPCRRKCLGSVFRAAGVSASGSERSAVLGDSDGLLLRHPDLAPQPRRRNPVARLAAHRSRRQACGGGQAREIGGDRGR